VTDRTSVHAAVLAVLAAATLVASSAEAKRRPPEPPTLGDLATATAPITPETPVEADANVAAQSYRDFLAIQDADPRMRAVFEKVARACKAHGKSMGVGGARGDRELQRYLIDLGVRYLTSGSDVGYLMAAGKADVEAIRKIKA